MVIEPVFGLINHALGLQRLHLELFAAALIVLCTVVYLTRIIGISFSYGIGGKRAPRLETVGVEASDKPYTGPFLAG
jgi:hypothetical protein